MLVNLAARLTCFLQLKCALVATARCPARSCTHSLAMAGSGLGDAMEEIVLEQEDEEEEEFEQDEEEPFLGDDVAGGAPV